jgi:hypothetical protein
MRFLRRNKVNQRRHTQIPRLVDHLAWFNGDKIYLSGGSNAGKPGNTERGVKKSEMGTDQRTNPPPAQTFL